MLALLPERGLTLGTAESCTGGLVAARLTGIPGSSDVFRGGVVAYGNEVKERELGVPAALLAEHGAVSPEVAEAMAQGARSGSASTSRSSVTGIAGPDGGSEEKPVGLVYLHAEGPAAASAASSASPATALDPRPLGRRRAPSRATSCHGVVTKRTPRRLACKDDERLRLFLALRLPDAALDTLAAWQQEHLTAADGPCRPARAPPLTLAFLGHRPAAELPGILEALRAAATASPSRPGSCPSGTARRGASGCSSSRTREGARRRSPATSRTARGARRLPARAPGMASPPHRCPFSEADRARRRPCRIGEHMFSFRPTPLLTCHDCGRAGRNTRSSTR